MYKLTGNCVAVGFETRSNLQARRAEYVGGLVHVCAVRRLNSTYVSIRRYEHAAFMMLVHAYRCYMMS